MIRRQRILIAATASLAMAFGAAAFADDHNKQPAQYGQQPGQLDRHDQIGSAIAAVPALPPGIAPKELGNDIALRELLAKTTKAAFTKGGFDKLVGHFNDQDRDRIGEVKIDDERMAKLDGRIEQIRQAWQSRYGEEFTIHVGSGDDLGALGGITLLRGEIQDPALVIQNWPVNAREFASAALDRAAGAVADVGDAPVAAPGMLDEAKKPGGGDVNLDKGREVAIAFLPAVGTHHKPVTVSIIGEVQAWKIDVPNSVDANKLYDNLLNHLTAFGEKEAQWPADKFEAQRKATQCVMMALYDIPMAEKTYTGQ